jgi:hypothetical protein
MRLFISMCLTLVAAIALWQMRRISFYIFAVRLVIAVVQFVRLLLRHPVPVIRHSSTPPLFTPDQLHTITIFVSFLGLVLSGAITWYVYIVTKTQDYPAETLESL